MAHGPARWRIEGRRHPSPRPTAVLVLVTVMAVVVSLVVRDRSPTTTAPRPAQVREGVVPGAVAQALARATALDRSPRTWGRIADCESGEWDADAVPVPGSADWAFGSGASDAHFQGGLHFAPETWEAFRRATMPAHAGEATPVSQMLVAERVHDEQGWRAWPVCSEKLGFR